MQPLPEVTLLLAIHGVQHPHDGFVVLQVDGVFVATLDALLLRLSAALKRLKEDLASLVPQLFVFLVNLLVLKLQSFLLSRQGFESLGPFGCLSRAAAAKIHGARCCRPFEAKLLALRFKLLIPANHVFKLLRELGICNLQFEDLLIEFKVLALLFEHLFCLLQVVFELLDHVILLLNREFESVVGRAQHHDLLPDVKEVLDRLQIVLHHRFFFHIFVLLLDIFEQLLGEAISLFLFVINISHSIKEPRQRSLISYAQRQRVWVREKHIEHLHASLIWLTPLIWSIRSSKFLTYSIQLPVYK